MPTPFERDARLSASIDKVWGEGFTFAAKKVSSDDVNLPGADDASRPTFDVVGSFEDPGKSAFPRARGSTADDNAHQWSASMPSVSVDISLLRWLPQRGDRATRKFDGAQYEVSKVHPDGFGRLTIFLTSKAAA